MFLELSASVQEKEKKNSPESVSQQHSVKIPTVCGELNNFIHRDVRENICTFLNNVAINMTVFNFAFRREKINSTGLSSGESEAFCCLCRRWPSYLQQCPQTTLHIIKTQTLSNFTSLFLWGKSSKLR
eukprot:c26244_g1_i1.p3 GENE.c26244_g1_i1~~c26244_g1_i1.p3  ORF type:complete len:128 (-),score=14.55 c26244_g1_i1:729-1112(-)